ncbi:MAG: YbhB/YbcL family Raf kinase inhibitor-like protein [Gammaproteobacteria bacterium]|nr:YbhB/YbcL family Raf kinase inhibitor-like protein [Pseudomonadales bacterium]MCP5347394.1 YbhB/YbcL family Raf kinase inhibitor-like protein [Pseudomonadales bacterium]
MRSKLFNSAIAVLAMMTLGITQVAAQGFQLPNMQVTSNAFADGGIIPLKYTSHGDNVQPNLSITGAPDSTVSYAIIFHDIEVALGGGIGDVTHWLAWNISSPNIPEGSLPAGSVQGNNIRGQASYMGPGAPYADRYHHYVFEIYALNDTLDLAEGASRDQLIAAMAGKVVGKTAYVGRYANAQGN